MNPSGTALNDVTLLNPITPMPTLNHLQQPLLALARQAGAAILEIYQLSRQYPVQTKPDHSPLTQADLIAHEIITNGLQSLTPDVPILSEEGIHTPWETRQQWHDYWLIDPLDGTLPFIHHKDEFTVNIALIQNNKPVIGLLYVPVTQVMYYGDAITQTAWKWEAAGQAIPLRVRSWQAEQTTILTSIAAREARISAAFGHLGAITQIKMSSAWKFGWVAEGKADLSPRFGDTSEWDTAAGQCILEQAGGALVDLHGQPLRYNTKDSLINPHFIALGDAPRLHPALFGRGLSSFCHS